MARNHAGMSPGFYIHSESYWSKEKGGNVAVPDVTGDVYDEVMVGMYDMTPEDEGGGGTTGEFGFKWFKSRDRNREDSIRLEAYDDGWSALANMPHLLMVLNNLDEEYSGGKRSSPPSPQEFAKMLEGVGFIDRTQRTPRSKSG